MELLSESRTLPDGSEKKFGGVLKSLHSNSSELSTDSGSEEEESFQSGRSSTFSDTNGNSVATGKRLAVF